MSLLAHHLSGGNIDQNNLKRKSEELYCGDDDKNRCLLCRSSQLITRGSASGELSITLMTETKLVTTDASPAETATIGSV